MLSHSQAGFHCAPSSLEPACSFIFKDLRYNLPSHLISTPDFKAIDSSAWCYRLLGLPPNSCVKTQIHTAFQVGYLWTAFITHCDHYAISPEQQLLSSIGVFSSVVQTVVLQMGDITSRTSQASLRLSSIKHDDNNLHLSSIDAVTKLPTLELQTTFWFPAFKL